MKRYIMSLIIHNDRESKINICREIIDDVSYHINLDILSYKDKA